MRNRIFLLVLLLGAACGLRAEAWYSSPLQAQEMKFGNALKWSTIWEINMKEFVIEKSLDGIAFDEIATLQAASFSNVDKSYHYLDVNPMADASYYRLKEIAENGKYSYSQMIFIEQKRTNDLHMVSMTNVLVSKDFNVKFDAMKELEATCTLKNYKGQVLDTFTQKMKNGLNDIKLNLEQRAPGVYFFTVKNGDELESFTLTRVTTEETKLPPVADTRHDKNRN